MITILNAEDTTNLESLMFTNGLLNVLPSSFYQQYSLNSIQVVMVKYGIYVLPTTELIDWLRTMIIPPAIEIGAGLGSIGRALSIPTTDSHLQSDPAVAAYYKMLGQSPIQYPDDVEKLTALDAIAKYTPHTVIGAFVTHLYNGVSGNPFGVAEEKIITGGCKYINIGNANTHADKPLLQLPHITFNFDWLLTRSGDQTKNSIWVWN